MSKFKAGDQVRYMHDHSDTATVLAVYEGLYWVKYGDEDWPFTTAAVELDRDHEPIPEGGEQ